MSDTSLQVKIWRGTGATDSGRFVDYSVPRQIFTWREVSLMAGGYIDCTSSAR